MTNKNTRRGFTQIKRGGFTLIELLVGVLIIGILAAVAVPQYKVAVTKSRTSTILPIVKALADAQEVYYLTHGEYAWKTSDLDIDSATNCTHLNSAYDNTQKGEMLMCSNYFVLDNDTAGSINANYCPDNTTTWDDCKTNREFQIAFRLKHWNNPASDAGKQKCLVFHNSNLGNKICANFAGYIYQAIN